MVHEDVPLTEKQALHVGAHVDPLAKVDVQSPTPALVGAAIES